MSRHGSLGRSYAVKGISCKRSERWWMGCAFDVQEIISGAQRIHDLSLLETRAKAKGIPLDGLASYLAAFKHGAEPHGEFSVEVVRC